MNALVNALAAQAIVIAKAPAAGRVKTRLTPPFPPAIAARLAEAALCDTLHTVVAAPFQRRVLALDGEPGRWLPPGFDVIAQRGGGLDERLAAAFSDAYRGMPSVLIGMDTPQVTVGMLAAAAEPLIAGTADAAFGPAADGGFWLLGLARPADALLLGVPMSRSDTGARQLARLREAGLRVAMVPELTDVDTFAEAELIADAIRGSRFAAAFFDAMAMPQPPGGPTTVTSVP